MKKWTALIMTLAVALAACGSDGATVSAADCEAGETDGDLSFYNWAEYIDPDLITAFEAEAGIAVEYTEYESNEEMLAQIDAGAAVYDLIVPSDYMVATMIAEELLVPLNADALPNLANLDPDFKNLPFDPAAEYSVPYQWGTTGIGVNVANIGDDFDPSWALIFDPEVAAQYEGRIGMLDDAPEAMSAAFRYLGYTIAEVIEDENLEAIAEAEAVLTAANELVTKYDSVNFADDLVNGELDVSHGWSGGMVFALDEAENPDDFVYFIPKEGGVRWVDNLAIPVTAEHPCSASAMINFLMDAENGAQLTNWNYYPSPNAASLDFIDQEVLDNPAIYPPAEDISRLEFIPQMGDLGLEVSDAFARSKG